MKKVLITSGGTREYIDDIRVLTNISTGKLGAIIANYFNNNGIDVTYVHVEGSILPDKTIKCVKITNVDSLKNVMEKLVPEMDIVIHAMAVSDFSFLPINTKLKSNDPKAFIDSLYDRIVQTPKILPLIKQWNPDCFVVSFKFEVNLQHDELINIAKKSLINKNSNIVIANDKYEMVKEKTHKAYAIFKNLNDYEEILLNGKNEIAEFLFNYLKIIID
jgi:phosphopantothenate-cysteine ligase